MSCVTRPKVHDESLRASLIAEASKVIALHGRDSLNLRRVAKATGTSTTAIYSLFGSKDELITAVNVAAFDSFEASQRAIPVTDDPFFDLCQLGRAYRDWALSHPHFYAGMFRAGDLSDPGVSAMAPLMTSISRCIDHGLMKGHPPTVSALFWACVHGFVTLELEGQLKFFPDPTVAYERLLLAHAAGWVVEGHNPGLPEGEWLRQIAIRVTDTSVA